MCSTYKSSFLYCFSVLGIESNHVCAFFHLFFSFRYPAATEHSIYWPSSLSSNRQINSMNQNTHSLSESCFSILISPILVFFCTRSRSHPSTATIPLILAFHFQRLWQWRRMRYHHVALSKFWNNHSSSQKWALIEMRSFCSMNRRINTLLGIYVAKFDCCPLTIHL